MELDNSKDNTFPFHENGNLFSVKASLRHLLPISQLCIIFQYFDRKGVQNVWAPTHVGTHTRSLAENKKEPGRSSFIVVVTRLSLPYQLKYIRVDFSYLNVYLPEKLTASKNYAINFA